MFFLIAIKKIHRHDCIAFDCQKTCQLTVLHLMFHCRFMRTNGRIIGDEKIETRTDQRIRYGPELSLRIRMSLETINMYFSETLENCDEMAIDHCSPYMIGTEVRYNILSKNLNLSIGESRILSRRNDFFMFLAPKILTLNT